MPADLPPNAQLYVPVLVREVCQHWPAMPAPYFLGSQVEQETCASLKSKKCWSPTVEFKTAREYGFGLGQLTVTSSFNNFNESLKLSGALADWKWEDRYNPAYQLRTLVFMDKRGFDSFPFAATPKDQMAFMFASYNGGIGGALNDAKLCKGTKGCDPTRWFGNVEKTSLKSKIKWQGYGKSAFEINREYVFNVLRVRFVKYMGPLRAGICEE